RSSLDEAVQAGRIKSEILTKMSHAVRTPMNGIIGLMELVLDTELSQEQREFLQIARSSARSLLTVINDVLDLTNLEAGKLTLEASDFSLRHSLGDLLRALAVRAQEKGLDLAFRVSPDVPDGLVGDPARLRQVIINLVDNAIKFTERGEIVVDVSMSAGQGPSPVEVELQFSVADTGIGIPANKRDTIFEPFVQGSTSVTRKYGGTGLGLTISANLVEKMGGRIWVNSEVGKGSTFYFTAPLRVSSDPAANALPPGLPRLWGLPALVVDSHATSRRIVEEMLLQWHMKPQTVGDTQTALALVEEAAAKGEPFPLVLVDGHNLDVDSFLLAQQFHRRQELVGATIMMLLPRSRSAATTLCREVGIAATVTKPIKQSDLLDAIVRALRISFQDNRWRAGGSVTGLFLPGRPLRVLLVEDNDVNQKLAIRILKKQGHTVVPAVHGKEALSLLDHQAFDLVLMDLQMPEMDGIEATTQIRAREEGTGRHIPIIALTAHAMHGDRERCLAAGMDGYISKPVRPDEIAKAIEAVLGSGAAPAPTVASELAETQKV
ncbi:MAG TPA: response regulator, partial [Gemmataceae bacterium]|nr:response regulator [Gemmataceae bacterium]